MSKGIDVEKGKNGDWVNIPGEYEPDYKGKPKGKRRVIPAAVLRKIAHESHEGGTAFCPYCSMYFAMYYMRRVHTKPFTIELVCCDCRKAHGFILADK